VSRTEFVGECSECSDCSDCDTLVVKQQCADILHLLNNWCTFYVYLFFYYQYSETNVMHFLFNLLKIKGLYMFRALLAHPQEALNKWHLVFCVCVMSVGRIMVQPTDITRSQYTKYCLCIAS
jgi:hypothetical protein